MRDVVRRPARHSRSAPDRPLTAVQHPGCIIPAGPTRWLLPEMNALRSGRRRRSAQPARGALPTPPAWFDGIGLAAHFQPVVSLAHGRSIGHEALLRGTDAGGRDVPPAEIFLRPSTAAERVALDQLAHEVHADRFAALALDDHWLFLNVHPDAFVEAPAHGRRFADLLASRGLSRRRVVLEVLEQPLAVRAEVEAAIAHFRALGCLIALDDFGAGHSNFDRVWNLRPDLVKLDRSLATQAVGDALVRRMLPRIVSLLHEAGALVVLEGVETREQALIAMESDIDFAQGWYFGRPAPVPPDATAHAAVFSDLWSTFDARAAPGKDATRRALAPYQHALGHAATLVEAGVPVETASRGFLDLPQTLCAFVLDDRGRQVRPNLLPAARPAAPPLRFEPIVDAIGANWSRRAYFRRAIEHPGKVQISRPYLSLDDASQCITFSIALRRPGHDVQVLCGNVRWHDRGSGVH